MASSNDKTKYSRRQEPKKDFFFFFLFLPFFSYFLHFSGAEKWEELGEGASERRPAEREKRSNQIER